jgi:hypothetical protein
MLSLKTKLILFSLLALAALAAGLWWSQHLTSPTASTAPPKQAVETVRPKIPALPPIANPPKATPTPLAAGNDSTGQVPLADLEAKIRGLDDVNWRQREGGGDSEGPAGGGSSRHSQTARVH